MNRKYNILLFCYILFTGCIISCSADDPAINPQEEEYREEVQVEVLLNGVDVKTRANIAGDTFVDGDTFKIFFNSGKPKLSPTDLSPDSIRKYTYQLATKKWTAEKPLYWDDQEIRLRYICAITPHANYTITGSGNTDIFTVEEDQSTANSYLKSDLLISRIMTNKRLVTLPFNHVLSRVVVNIKAPTTVNNPDGWFELDDFGDDIEVALTNMYATGNIVYGNGVNENASDITTIAQSDNPNALKKIKMFQDIAPAIQNDTIRTTYVAIIPPRNTFDNTEFMLSVKLSNGKTYLYKPANNVSNFAEQGKETTINIILNKVKLDILPPLITDITINEWGSITAEDDDPIKL